MTNEPQKTSFEAGDKVFVKTEKRLATVLDVYGDGINGHQGEIRLDVCGNTSVDSIEAYDPDKHAQYDATFLPIKKQWKEEYGITKDIPLRPESDDEYLETFLNGYMVAALWSSTFGEDGEHPFDYRYDTDDFTEEAAASMREDCTDFVTHNADLLKGIDPSQAGHDFWLTRNRHGAGFWDRGLGEIGIKLTEAAQVYGSSDLFETDEALVENRKVGVEGSSRPAMKP